MTDLAEPLPGVPPAARRHPATGYLLYLVAALLFALNGVVAKTLLLGGMEASRLSQLRATLAFLILLGFVAHHAAVCAFACGGPRSRCWWPTACWASR